MKANTRFLLLLFFLNSLNSSAQSTTPVNEPPAWSKEVIWYQIFVERFNNGDKANDPTPATIDIAPLKLHAPTGWSITPWTSD